ncbi:MAG: hypothetical protein M1814_003420 [Vezdaea aestivalis]|nr:MAG: hypothetical protein M1814_003420 [Vezdaea aestivalis]
MEDEEDDIFGGAGAARHDSIPDLSSRPKSSEPPQPIDDLEEGEEEEEEDESDSDIEFITEYKGAAPLSEPNPPASKGGQKRPIPVTKPQPEKTSSTAEPAKPTVTRPGSDFPAIATSKIDIDANPIFEPAGKPITQVDLDEDFRDDDKPWRRPGSDVTDFFNYGFDEFSWASYCLRHDKMKSDIQEEKSRMQEMNMMMNMGGMGMPGMPGVPTGPGAGAQADMGLSQMAGMPDMPAGMQEMMNQYLRAGGTPNQMDPAAMYAAMQQSGAAPSGPAASTASNQGQAYAGAAQGFGQNQQQMGFGYDQNMMGNNEGGRNRQGNFGNRGRSGRRW